MKKVLILTLVILAVFAVSASAQKSINHMYADTTKGWQTAEGIVEVETAYSNGSEALGLGISNTTYTSGGCGFGEIGPNTTVVIVVLNSTDTLYTGKFTRVAGVIVQKQPGTVTALVGDTGEGEGSKRMLLHAVIFIRPE